MYVNWLTRSDNHHRDEGTRPSFAEIREAVDCSDPAFPQIAQALLEAREAGAELDAAAVEEAIHVGRQRHAAPPEELSAEERIAPAFKSIVYYLLRGPLVKIGTTRRPESRFASLMPDRIMAIEPGDRSVERERHQQFKHLRHGTSEYFSQGDDLAAYIDTVRAQYGAPNPAWPSIERIDRPRIDFHIAPPAASSAELVTATQGADRVGARRNTVAVWARRGRLSPVGTNERGQSLYFLDDVKFLAARSAAMTAARVVRRP